MEIIMSWLGVLRKIGQKAGPYLVLEMLLPGGTLFALLLFLWQRRRPDIRSGAQRAVHFVTRTWAGSSATHFWCARRYERPLAGQNLISPSDLGARVTL